MMKILIKEDEDIKKAHEAGASIDLIAKGMKMSVGEIEHILKDNGLL